MLGRIVYASQSPLHGSGSTHPEALGLPLEYLGSAGREQLSPSKGDDRLMNKRCLIRLEMNFTSEA